METQRHFMQRCSLLRYLKSVVTTEHLHKYVLGFNDITAYCKANDYSILYEPTKEPINKRSM